MKMPCHITDEKRHEAELDRQCIRAEMIESMKRQLLPETYASIIRSPTWMADYLTDEERDEMLMEIFTLARREDCIEEIINIMSVFHDKAMEIAEKRAEKEAREHFE